MYYVDCIYLGEKVTKTTNLGAPIISLLYNLSKAMNSSLAVLTLALLCTH